MPHCFRWLHPAGKCPSWPWYPTKGILTLWAGVVFVVLNQDNHLNLLLYVTQTIFSACVSSSSRATIQLWSQDSWVSSYPCFLEGINQLWQKGSGLGTEKRKVTTCLFSRVFEVSSAKSSLPTIRSVKETKKSTLPSNVNKEPTLPSDTTQQRAVPDPAKYQNTDEGKRLSANMAQYPQLDTPLFSPPSMSRKKKLQVSSQDEQFSDYSVQLKWSNSQCKEHLKHGTYHPKMLWRPAHCFSKS